LKNLALSIAGAWDAHHHPLVDGGHIKFWSRRTLAQLLSDEGFEEVAFQGAGRLPFLWKSMILMARR
jgi:2-polyprenyl-6-hydroxyphenyl methylase/3-demethylubiquinone-9 3-methyltransferase